MLSHRGSVAFIVLLLRLPLSDASSETATGSSKKTIRRRDSSYKSQSNASAFPLMRTKSRRFAKLNSNSSRRSYTMDSAGSTSSKTGTSYVISEEARPGPMWNNALLNGIISGGKQEALATNMGVVSSGYRNDFGKSNVHPSSVVENIWSRQSAHDSIVIRRLYNTVSTKAND
jgi:hypothetical protein